MVATERSANGRQLLLLAALLFGIVTMHTLGHPTGHSASTATSHTASHSTGQSVSQTVSQSTSQSVSHASEQAGRQHEMSAADPAPDTAAPADASADSGAAGTGGMDPLSVCLAVLAALTLVLLLKAGLLRPGGFAVAVRPLARLLDGLRPNPPPPRILLSRLSVLRI
ncbi:hypothetical protein ABZ916_43810 [Streptomyces sp. NPDC046853]|uniref:hypothetical protein n=1 Tax=Streptomyces sp. NPDC046853 TaxID=3154920 RepID=UPI0033CC21EA